MTYVPTGSDFIGCGKALRNGSGALVMGSRTNGRRRMLDGLSALGLAVSR